MSEGARWCGGLPELCLPLGCPLLVLCPWGESEGLLLFMVPKAHWTVALNGCHRDAGHWGHDRTLSLLWECSLVARNGQTNETIYQGL